MVHCSLVLTRCCVLSVHNLGTTVLNYTVVAAVGVAVGSIGTAGWELWLKYVVHGEQIDAKCSIKEFVSNFR